MKAAFELKEIRWRGDSRECAQRFPKGTRLKLGRELTRIQMGLPPRNGKWLAGIGQGVREVRIAHHGEAYRIVYIAIFEEAIYVLHAFHKKSRTGIETPQEAIDLASRRYRDLVRERTYS